MTVEVTGLAEVKARIDRVRRRLRNAREVNEEIAADLRAVIAQAYTAQTSPAGQRWAPTQTGTVPFQSFRALTQVTSTDRSITMHIAHHAAGYQIFGTPTIPSRMPLPITRDGERDTSPVWQRIEDRLESALSGEE